MFKEQYIRDNEKLHAKETLLMEIQKKAEEQKNGADRRAKWTRYAAVAAAAVLVLGGVLGVVLSGGQRAQQSATGATLSASPADAGTEAFYEITAANDYDQIYALIEEMGYTGLNLRAAAGEGLDGAMPAPQANAAASTEAAMDTSVTADAGEGGYSQTNVQVQGVDEADIVKTDGKYIYYIAGNQLNILEAAGAGTRLVSSTELANNDKWWGYASEMFLLGERLMVITQGTASVWVNDGGSGYSDSREQTRAAIYDVKNPGRPTLVTSLGQSGSYVSSRMVGDYVYLITSQYVWSCARSDPGTYIPQVSVDGEATTLAAGDILIYGQPKTPAYTVIGAINLREGSAHETARATFGGSNEIYCNAEHLLLACYDNERSVSDIAPDETGKNVQVTSSSSVTKLMLFSLDGAKIEKLAAGSVPGGLLNQFAMDEYQGVFRIVTTVSNWVERVYTDGVDSYEYEDENYNCLYTLDQNLEIIGKVERLAEDEWVESVRFDGDVGYFVTFRQVDPLFAVDLSDPKNPRVLSSLKIPGFSEYLHKFGQNLLLGVGYDADEETGQSKGVKLSMFDVSNKRAVREVATEKLDAGWTVVGSNHKAILVDADKNLIAFPADSAYYLYAYSEQEGFTQLQKISMTDDLYSWNLRGLFIGDNFYVLSDSAVTVISLSDYSKLANVSLAVG